MFGYFYNSYLFVDIFISFKYQFSDLIFLFLYLSGSLNIFKTIILKIFFSSKSNSSDFLKDVSHPISLNEPYFSVLFVCLLKFYGNWDFDYCNLVTLEIIFFPFP